MRRVGAVALAAAVLGGVGCSGPGAVPAPDAGVAAQQREREQRVRERQAARGSALDAAESGRQAAAGEALRSRRVRGRDVVPRFELRYGSDGTGDPARWRQSGPDATRAPTSTPETIARFEGALASRRIVLTGAAKPDEVRRGLIDDRVLDLLLELSTTHRLTVNSLRETHPHTVQDELGTPTTSNHVYGRAADISAVDGAACARETAGADYRTATDNPPPRRRGPCLALAYEAAAVAGRSAPEEIIFFWRVPGPAGVSLANHADHVHLGFRSYRSARGPVGQWETGAFEAAAEGG